MDASGGFERGLSGGVRGECGFGGVFVVLGIFLGIFLGSFCGSCIPLGEPSMDPK